MLKSKAAQALQVQFLLLLAAAAAVIVLLVVSVSAVAFSLLLGSVLLSIVIALWIAWNSYRRERILQEAHAALARIVSGEKRYRAYLNSQDTAMSRLEETINILAEKLEAQDRHAAQQEGELDLMLASMDEGMFVVDGQAKIVRMNQAAVNICHIDGVSSLNRMLYEVIRHKQLQAMVERTLRDKLPQERDLVFFGEEERFVHVYTRVIARSETTTKSIRVLVVLSDRTLMKRLENVRRDFVANVSHEFKTPLTSIKGFVETLEEGALAEPETAKRFLGIIKKHTHRLQAIFDDLLLLSELERDDSHADIEKNLSSLSSLLISAIEVVSDKAEAKGVELRLTCPEQIRVVVNSSLMEQAVVNLIDNAIKYSEPDSLVEIVAKDFEREVGILVIDQGCGIPSEQLGRVFERFYRVDAARSRTLGGTGLGLSIVKHVALAHDGRVEVESQVGKGSEFAIYFPKMDLAAQGAA